MNNLYTYGSFALFFLALFTDFCYILDAVSKVNPPKRNVINIFKMLQEGLFVSRSNWINIFKCHMYLQVLVTQRKKWKSLSRVRPFVTPWTVAGQASLSMGILQARILEWVAMLSSRWSSQPRDQTQVSRIAGRFFTIWATREALKQHK